MQINSLECCRPKRRINTFTGEYNSENKKRMRRKHYKQMNDDVLATRSVIKAHKEVAQSPKGQLIKAMPNISTSLILTSLALAQPGKLSAKAAAGLGFLALFKSIDSTLNTTNEVIEKCFKNVKPTEETEKNKLFLKVGTFFGTAATLSLLAFVGIKSGKKIANKHFAPVVNFAKKEAATLANEIDNTKLGKFFENKVLPFSQKHKKLMSGLKTFAPLGLLIGSMGAQAKLINSASKDIKNKSFENYVKGKLIQEKAREDFDKLEGIEVQE